MCLGACASAVCCAGREVCDCCCVCCKEACGTSMRQQIRLCYIILEIVCMLIAIFVLYGVQETMSWMDYWIHCPQASNQKNGTCMGVSSVYRMSFTLVIFYAIIIIFCLFRNIVSKVVNEGMWFLKVVFILTMFIIFFFIPVDFFQGYVTFSQVFSALFMVFQSIMLIDLFYMWGQSWAKQYDEGRQSCQYFMIGAFLILYTAVIVFNVYNFIWFKGCTVNVTINVINVILIIAITAVQLMGLNPHGSIITSGAQSLYMTFLTYSSQITGPNCNNFLNGSEGMLVQLAIGIFLIVLVLFYLTFGKKENSAQIVKVAENADIAAQVLVSNEQQQEDKEEEEIEDLEAAKAEAEAGQDVEISNVVKKETKQIAKTQQKIADDQYQKLNDQQQLKEKIRFPAYQDNSYIIFHFVMLTASVYVTMLITSWGSININSNVLTDFIHSNLSYWMQIIISWISALIYIWTLIAPSIFKNRSFQ